MASKGVSIAARTADALGIPLSKLPEKLRNSLNYYLKNTGIANILLQPNNTLYSPHYQDRSISGRNEIFLRNLVLMDTLFDDKKKIVKWINGEQLSKGDLQSYFSQWQAKEHLYQSLTAKHTEISSFFQQSSIDWCTEQIPYPFNDGHFSSVDLISQNIAADPAPSLYDQALKLVIGNQYGQLGSLISNHQGYFSVAQYCWLSDLYKTKLQEHQELLDLLP